MLSSLEEENAREDLRHGRCARATAATCKIWAVALDISAFNRNKEAAHFTTPVFGKLAPKFADSVEDRNIRGCMQWLQMPQVCSTKPDDIYLVPGATLSTDVRDVLRSCSYPSNPYVHRQIGSF